MGVADDGTVLGGYVAQRRDLDAIHGQESSRVAPLSDLTTADQANPNRLSTHVPITLYLSLGMLAC